MKVKKTLSQWCQEQQAEKLLEMYELGKNEATADIIGCGTAKAIHLKCPTCEMVWSTNLNHATRKKAENSCPFCSHKRAWKGYNLAIDLPGIVHYWDYEKNEHAPEFYTPGSHESVHFKCEKGHTWTNIIKETRVADSRKSLCPYCNHSRPSSEYNLENQCPEIASEWNYENNNGKSPREFLPFSHEEVNWKCSFNPAHHWSDRISNRTILHRECKLCNKQYKISYASRAMFYYLKMIYPDAECEVSGIKKYKLDILLTSQRIVIEHDGYFYHSDEDAKKREQRKDLDLMNANYKVIRVKEKVCEEDTIFWERNVLWYPYSEQKFTLNQMIIELIYYLSGKTIQVDHWNDYQKIKELYFHERKMKSLAVLYPELAKEWSQENTEKCDMVLTGASKNYDWTCPKCHRDYPATIPNRVNKKSGCPFCANRKATSSNNLAVIHPKLKEEWDDDLNGDLKPENVLPGTDKNVFWKCDKGHSWTALIYQRTGKAKSGCPYCSHAKATKETCLSTLKPYVIPFWDEKKNDCLPTDVLANSNKKYWWKCKEGHSWPKSLNGITETSIKKFCPYCNNRKVDDENNMLIQYPNIASEWDEEKNGDLDPKKLLPNNTKDAYWICSKGHSYKAKICSRCLKGKGCSICAGYFPSEEYNFKLVFPKIAKEWDKEKNGKLKPEGFLPFSGKSVWWKCKKGHSWEMQISKRTVRHYGCPFCSGTRVAIENSLATLRPDIAKLWEEKNELTPEQVSQKSGKRVNWKCDKGHTWNGTVINIVNCAEPCPICRNINKSKRKELSSK